MATFTITGGEVRDRLVRKYETIQELNKVLFDLSSNLDLKKGGYDKVDFMIEHEGQEWRGRIDVSYMANHNLLQHCMDHLRFYSGNANPSHISETDYKNLIKEFGISEKNYNFWMDFLKSL
jgi:hypothetical protein